MRQAAWIAFALGLVLSGGGTAPAVGCALITLLASAAALSFSGPARVEVPTWAWALLGGSAVSLSQLVPLPEWLRAQLSPRATELLALGTAELGLDQPWRPLSWSPADTALSALWLAGAALAAVVGARATRTPRLRHEIDRAMTTAAAITVVLVVIHSLVGARFFMGIIDPAGRGFSPLVVPFVNINHFAAWAYVQAGWLLAWPGHRRERPIRIILAAALVLLVPLTLSRAGTAALVVMVAASSLGWALRAHGRAQLRSRLLTTAAGAGGAILLTVAVLGPARSAVFSPRSMTALDEKAKIWRGAIEVFSAFPVTGVGHGGHWAAHEILRRDGIRPTVRHPESSYLQPLVDLGASGLFLIVLGGATAMIALWRSRPFRPEVPPAPLVVGAATLGLAVHGLADVPLSNGAVAIPFWLALGMATSGVRRPSLQRNPPRHRASSPRRRQNAAAPTTLAAAAVVGALWIPPWTARGTARQMDALADRESTEEAFRQHFSALVRAAPADGWIWLQAGERWLEGDPERARRAAFIAQRLLPTRSDPPLLAARAAEALRRPEEAMAHLRTSLELALDPPDERLRQWLASRDTPLLCRVAPRTGPAAESVARLLIDDGAPPCLDEVLASARNEPWQGAVVLWAAVARGDLDAATALAANLAPAAPGRAEALLALAGLCFQQGQGVHTVRWTDHILTETPSRTWTRALDLGIAARLAQGQPEQAIELVTRLRGRPALDAPTRAALGAAQARVHLHRRELRAAHEEALGALALQPADPTLIALEAELRLAELRSRP